MKNGWGSIWAKRPKRCCSPARRWWAAWGPVLLFTVLPTLVVAGIGHFVELGRWPRVIIEGVLKVCIFLGYMFLISRMKEIERVFRYHGAEHKTIACYEAGDPPDGGRTSANTPGSIPGAAPAF